MNTKPNAKRFLLVLSLAVLSLAVLVPSTQAGSVTNNFDVTRNFLTTGVIGETNWDGVYLGFGDIPGGNPGGSGNGSTVAADANVSFPAFLTVQTTGSDWSDVGDDGFFLWKLVAGDFDVSVESAPPWNSVGFNFAGLLARAYNTNNTGSPFSVTSTNAAENWVALFRFQEFGLNEVRESIDGVNTELTFPEDNSDTNSSRFFRMVRSSQTNFTFFWKTNLSDSWSQITNNLPAGGVLTRPDMAGVSLQVGIAQAMFSTASAQVYFTDFELNGTNVSQAALPAAPSNVTIASPNPSGSVNIGWTPGAGSGGSLVVLRGAFAATPPPIIVNPIGGITYSAATNYMNTNAWIAGREQVMYAGTDNSVTVTGLGGSNNMYSVAVYSYSGSGDSTVYNTATPATNSFAGPGTVASVLFTVSPTNIPSGGVGAATIIATYTSGDSYDVSADPNAQLSSSDSTIVAINNGVMNGLTNGSATITASYAGASGTKTVSVSAPIFTDNFSVSHDYIANGLQGTPWDGLFLNFGDVPGAQAGNDNAKGATSKFDANISSNAVLSIEAAGSTWAVAGNDGPFLYKVVTGDFQASVHVNSMTVINNNDAGLMARLFDNSGGATQGGGGGAGGAETHINWVKVQNGAPAARRTIDSGGTTIVAGLNATDGWLLMQRVNSTNFLFFEKANLTDPWTPVQAAAMSLPEAADNAPMEVGIEQEMRTASDGSAALDSLMIDGPGIVPPATPPPPATNLTVTLNNDLSMTFQWVAASETNTPIRSLLVMRAGGPVTAQPTLSQAGSIGGTGSPVTFGTGVNLGGGNWMVFATGNPAASTNVTATVKGLTPGVVYYAAVYTFTGSGATKSFNNVLPASGGTTNSQDGQLISITTLPAPAVPLGGIGQLEVIGNFTGGATVNVSPFANLVPADPNIIVTTNGALTGLTNGTTTVTVIYGGFTNTTSVTVRAPGFTDNFNVSHDYLANKVTGTGWDGIYLKNGDIPETTFVGTGSTLGADANIGAPGTLSITNANGQWENDGNDGFFLFKNVPGDFQMAVHIIDYDIIAYTFPGLGARAYSSGTNGTDVGAPFDLGSGTNGESWVSFTRFDEFGIGTYARLNLSNAVLQSTQPNPNDGDNWLLIIRQNGTNFNFYERASSTDPWKLTPLRTSYQVPQFAGVPMQVGIEFAQYTGSPAAAHLDHFMLDAAAAPPPELVLHISQSGTNVVLSWQEATGVALQSSPKLNPASWQAVPGTPTSVGGVSSLTLPATNTPALFFRLIQ